MFLAPYAIGIKIYWKLLYLFFKQAAINSKAAKLTVDY